MMHPRCLKLWMARLHLKTGMEVFRSPIILVRDKTRVHLKVSFNWDIVPCYDVIARIEGAQFPDEWIIRGNHQDAWVNGATDPVSGLSAMLEEARSFGNMMKTGWRPGRTLVYCAWDGEEPGLLGSTEWVEAHEMELKEKAVLYINSDGNGRGFLFVEGSHALTPLVDEISKQITDPQTGVSLFDRKKAHDAISASDMQSKKTIWAEEELKPEALGFRLGLFFIHSSHRYSFIKYLVRWGG